LFALSVSLPPQQRALLSNNQDGTPIFAAVSYTNFGAVDTQGLDLAINYYFDENWSASFSGSWFDFDLDSPSSSLADQLLPNSPEFKWSLRGGYVGSRLDASLGLRWVDDFRWVVGPFQGDVESYTTVDLSGNWRLAPGWLAGINVANLLDDEHWEAFGGDLLGRRALAHVLYQW
jgi:outer membrane receptor protein involved in Fe transport